MNLKVEVAGQSDVGCVRTNNEDHFGYDAEAGIFVVCDGMGGHASGEVASKLAVQTAIDTFREHSSATASPEDRAAALADAVQSANAAVFNSAARDIQHAGMGTTMVAVVPSGSSVSIANVGDSRVYLIRSGVIEQITDDHSLVMEQVRRGIITMEDAKRSEVQNIILRALGSEPQVEVDMHDEPVEPGDTLLLTSDGLCRHVDDAGILRIVSGATTLKDACKRLIETAKQAGGEDNVTCLLLRIR